MLADHKHILSVSFDNSPKSPGVAEDLVCEADISSLPNSFGAKTLTSTLIPLFRMPQSISKSGLQYTRRVQPFLPSPWYHLFPNCDQLSLC